MITDKTANFIAKLKQMPKHEHSIIDMIHFVNTKTNVQIGCPIEDHGYYFATPTHLLEGTGCPKCAFTYKSTKTFISELKENPKHENSKTDRVNYINNRIKIEIGCENHEHGYYFAQPRSLLRGSGCPKCGILTKSNKSFISELRQMQKHKNSRTDRINYINNITKIEIGCENYNHGYYFAYPRNLLHGTGCPKCTRNKYVKSTKTFINELKQMPKHKHSKTDRLSYSNCRSKVEIGCNVKDHDYYWMTPRKILEGSGCPRCAISGYNKNKPGILYYIKIKKGIYTSYKIGITNTSVKKRFPGEMKYITILREIHFQNGEHALNEENRIKEQFKDYKWLGQKLLISGNTEMFYKDILGLDNNK